MEALKPSALPNTTNQRPNPVPVVWTHKVFILPYSSGWNSFFPIEVQFQKRVNISWRERKMGRWTPSTSALDEQLESRFGKRLRSRRRKTEMF